MCTVSAVMSRSPDQPVHRPRPGTLFRSGLACLSLALALPAGARDGAIRHAEAVRFERALPAPTADGSAGSRQLEFEAYGRRFELALESNETVLRRLAPERRRALPPRALYKGKLVGQAGSWARLTLLQDGLHGLIHDGRELYLLAPAGRVRQRLLAPVDAAALDTLVFRAADTDGSGGTCEALDLRDQRTTLALEYESVGQELGTLRTAQADAQAVVLGRELQLAMLGDLEFSNRRLDPEGDLLALVNAADGIFAAQASVAVTAAEVRAFRQAPDPFDESDARALLDEIADYRNATPAIRATDVAHLATGRDLAGTTVGIAYRGAVCDPRNAVSLSEQNDPSAGYLIFAHELGHNLGAPHDGEAGSACSFEPRSYLMAPAVNFSSRLSPCSVEQLRTVVESASCLGVAAADGQLALIGSNLIGAFTTQPVGVQFEVASIGGEALRDARVEVTTGGLAVLGAAAGGSACAIAAGAADCRLGDLPPGTVRTVDLRIDAGSAPGQYVLRASLAAANDARPTNNVREATIRVQPGAVVEALLQSRPEIIQLGTRAQATAALRNAGVVALSGLTVDVESDTAALAIESLATAGGSCLSTGPQRWRCSYAGSLAPGDSYTLEATLLGASFGRATLAVRPLLPSPGTARTALASISIKPLVDVGLVNLGGTLPTRTVEGRPFELVLGAQVNGLQSSRGVVLTGALPEDLRLLEVIGADGCTIGADRQLRCPLGELAPGVTRVIQLVLEAALPGSPSIPFRLAAELDEIAANDANTAQLSVAADIDIGIGTAASLAPLKTGRAADYGFTVTTSRRAVPGASVRFTTSPSDLAIESVTTPVGSCTITSVQTSCSLGDLPPEATLAVTLRLRGLRAVESSVSASVATSALDADLSDQGLNRPIVVLPVGDAGVRAEAVSGQPRQGQPFELAAFTVTAQRATEQVMLDLTLPASVRVESATVPGSSCTIATAAVRCALGDLSALDSRRLELRIVPADVGSLTLAARVRSSDDDDPSNDAASLQLNVTTVLVQPPASGSGGGGGGALDPGWLLLLCGGLGARRRRGLRG
jgi:hypothetical protein